MMRKNVAVSIISFILVVMSSCSLFDEGTTLIDNPTSEDIDVTVDDKTYTIPTRQYKKIDIKEEGIHYVTCDKYGLNKAEVSFEKAGTKAGVINPTKSEYIIYYIIFTEKNLSSKFKPYDVRGHEIYSMFDAPEITTDLFIPDKTMGKGNLDNKIPKSMDYNRLNQDYAFLRKIFRLDDFFEFYAENNK